MSVGLRILLVMILVFGAISGYRLRLPLLEQVFAGRLSAGEEAPSTYSSPVNGLVDPRIRLTLEGKARPVAPPRSVETPGSWTLGHGFEPQEFEAEPAMGEDPGEGESFLLLADDFEEPYSLEQPRGNLAAAPFDRGDYADELLHDEFPQEELLQDELLGGRADVSAGEVEVLAGLPDTSADDTGDDTVEIRYTVGPDDNLWKIAKKFFGSGLRHGVIEEANAELLDRRGGMLRPGDELRIPVSVATQESLKIQTAAADRSVEERSVQKGAGSKAPEDDLAAEPALLHRVGRDENLTKIAQLYFPGDTQGWQRIFAANPDQLASPDLVYEGMLLRVPVQAPGGEGRYEGQHPE